MGTSDVLPHASPRDGWRHSWCVEGCPFHDHRTIALELSEKLQRSLIAAIDEAELYDGQSASLTVARMTVRQVDDVSKLILKRTKLPWSPL